MRSAPTVYGPSVVPSLLAISYSYLGSSVLDMSAGPMTRPASRGAAAGSVPSFVEKEKRRNLLLTKQIAQRGEGGIRREEGYHD